MHHASGMLWVAILVGLAAGCVLGVQPSVNGSLGKAVAHPYQAAFISFAVGTALLLILCLVTGVFPPSFQSTPGQLPWWIWSGGAIGVVVVTTSLFFVPRVGSVPWFAAIMTGQTLAAILLDHYGWMGNPQASASPLRLAGVGLLVAGVLVIAQAKRTEQAAKHSELAAQPSEQTAEQTAALGEPVLPNSANPSSTPVVESTNSE
ncbi:integral membrane protein [Rhodopirellula maiorica SM1]|uniref:Integral membrane protein n=1 Tax=Rhodopirellula maiorica SM1 TaxID=1265738 RepID=M5S409_9BACT|nr:DMT family transporter [Rhodopirellula maiorica]EMI20919.1 integral membrane protein [Rhodopirellula maiorica SM1]